MEHKRQSYAIFHDDGTEFLGRRIVEAADSAECEANVDFIVLACNEHDRLVAERDELLAVCKALLAHVEREDHTSAGPTYQVVTSQARAAIAKAEGRQE